jgi:hypothetical protein
VQHKLKIKRTPPTPEQIRAQQKRDAERNHRQVVAAVKAAPPPAIQVQDNRNSVQKYLDENAPASLVGRMAKFGKDGTFITADDDAEIGDDVDFTALCDQTLIGWKRFHEDGSPPDSVMGLLYDGFSCRLASHWATTIVPHGSPGLTVSQPTPGNISTI